MALNTLEHAQPARLTMNQSYVRWSEDIDLTLRSIHKTQLVAADDFLETPPTNSFNRVVDYAIQKGLPDTAGIDTKVHRRAWEGSDDNVPMITFGQ